MTRETPLSPKDPWVIRGIAIVAAVFVFSAVLGFAVLPLVQGTGGRLVCGTRFAARQAS